VNMGGCGMDRHVLVEGSVDFANVLDHKKFVE
jgi:hypothetical protein